MAQGRRALAQKLLTLQRKVADDLTAIDDCKEALRDISADTGESFTEEVEGLGAIEVKAGREAQLKGTCPELVIEAYLKASPRKQAQLFEDGFVKIAEVWSKAARPSVTVRL